MPNKPERKKKPWQTDRVAFGRRNNNNHNFYNASRWRRVSIAYRSANPFCECDKCVSAGLFKPAEVVDHTRGLQFLLDNGIDPYDWNELKSMTHACHNKKSGRSAHDNKLKK